MRAVLVRVRVRVRLRLRLRVRVRIRVRVTLTCGGKLTEPSRYVSRVVGSIRLPMLAMKAAWPCSYSDAMVGSL